MLHLLHIVFSLIESILKKSDIGPQDCSIRSSEAYSLLSRYNCSQIKHTENNGREMERVRDQFDGSQDSLLRIDSTESLDETDMSRPFYGPAVIRRTSSLDGLSKPWRTNGLVDAKRKKSSFSIAVSCNRTYNYNISMCVTEGLVFPSLKSCLEIIFSACCGPFTRRNREVGGREQQFCARVKIHRSSHVHDRRYNKKTK